MKFDALEDLAKARKAKGLANWKKLEAVSEKLQGKEVSHITFTTCYPGQEGSKKYLGSSSGNLHFLLGYVNPGFAVAPYHWQIVDPNLSDEEAKKKQHPANPRYWKESELDMVLEGDIEAGKPHKSATAGAKGKARVASQKQKSITIKAGYGTYIAVPEENRVYSMTNGQAYDWELVRESYFAATNPNVAEVMSSEEDEDEEDEEVNKSALVSLRGPIGSFHPDVYPLAKSLLPRPGSVFCIDDKFVLVKSDCVEFYDRDCNRLDITVYDRAYNSFDLKKGGDIHPSILSNFITTYLGTSQDDLLQFVHHEDDLPRFVKGLPSPGFSDETELPYPRNVEYIGKSLRVVVGDSA